MQAYMKKKERERKKKKKQVLGIIGEGVTLIRPRPAKQGEGNFKNVPNETKKTKSRRNQFSQDKQIIKVE